MKKNILAILVGIILIGSTGSAFAQNKGARPQNSGGQRIQSGGNNNYRQPAANTNYRQPTASTPRVIGPSDRSTFSQARREPTATPSGSYTRQQSQWQPRSEGPTSSGTSWNQQQRFTSSNCDQPAYCAPSRSPNCNDQWCAPQPIIHVPNICPPRIYVSNVCPQDTAPSFCPPPIQVNIGCQPGNRAVYNDSVYQGAVYSRPVYNDKPIYNPVVCPTYCPPVCYNP